VLRTGAVFIQHSVVQLCAIAFMLGKLVLGVFPVQCVGHVAVTADLGQNGRRRDRSGVAVAAYDTAVGRGDGGMLPVIPVAVDQRHVRLQGQAVDSHLHGLHSGRKDIRGVDLRSADTGYRPGQRRFRDDAVQGFPLLLRQLFRVVQAVDDALTGQNHRRRVHRAHQRPGAGLVHAADRLAALRPRFLFICPKLHGRSFQ